MTDNNIIKLYNRYRANLWLEKISDGRYMLKSSNEDDLQYMRCGYKDKDSIDTEGYEFIDPSGGPFLSLGSEYNGMVIKKIVSEKQDDGTYAYILTLE